MNSPHHNGNLSPSEHLRIFANRCLADNNVPIEFPAEITHLTKADITNGPPYNRRDLRYLPCFTIDSNDAMDLDDAISLRRKPCGFELSVHIADVSTYVPLHSPLDMVALERGTSIYLPHQTIPMLPTILSNELCSLAPNKERYALSIIIALDIKGKVKTYEVMRSLICSRVRGIYSEVNALLEGDRNPYLLQKYAEVSGLFSAMKYLAEKLREQRVKNGANISNIQKPKIILENGNINLIQEQKGIAESIIEEYMILANRLVAEYCTNNGLPVIYRVQHKKGSLAKYEVVKEHHAELALAHYVHFTSPIRRVADLKLHQVLSAHLDGMDMESLRENFDENLMYAAERASKCENRADHIYKPCQNFGICHFLSSLKENFTADVVGFNYRNRPLFFLDKYSLYLPGKSNLQVYKGQRVTVKLSIIDARKTKMEVYSIEPLKYAVG